MFVLVSPLFHLIFLYSYEVWGVFVVGLLFGALWIASIITWLVIMICVIPTAVKAWYGASLDGLFLMLHNAQPQMPGVELNIK